MYQVNVGHGIIGQPIITPIANIMNRKHSPSLRRLPCGTLRGLSTLLCASFMSLGTISTTFAQLQHQFTATAGTNWTNTATTAWSSISPYTIPTAGGPKAGSYLDLASTNGASLVLTSTHAVERMTVTSASVAGVTQLVTVINSAGYLDIGVSGSNTGLLSISTGSLSFRASSVNLDVHVNGNASVAQGSTLYLGHTNGSTSSAGLTSFAVTGTTTINGDLYNRYNSLNTSLGDVAMGSTGRLSIASFTGTESTSTTLTARSLSGSGSIYGANASVVGRQGTLSLVTVGTSTFNGVLANSFDNPGAGNSRLNLAVSGSGRQTLTGANTYTGSTSITGGSLILSGSGSINGTSGITINGGSLSSTSSTALTRNVTLTSGAFSYSSSGTYTGVFTYTAGTLGGTNWNGGLNNQVIGTGKTINPGNSPGTASTGSQTWASGGALNWEINDATGVAGTNWDQILLSNALSITATSGDTFTINILSLSGLSGGDAANFDASTSYHWLLADALNEITTFSADKFALNLAGFTNDYDGVWSIVRGDTSGFGDNTQLYINYNAVPEPSTYALVALGLGGIALLRRRSMKSQS